MACFERLRQFEISINPFDFPMYLLRICAMLASDYIPVRLFNHALPDRNEVSGKFIVAIDVALPVLNDI